MIRCIPMADNATPAASPTTSNSPVSRKIIDITALCCAPRALRMPISISLCAAPLHTKGLHRGLGPGIFFTGARYESPRPMNSVRSGNVFYNTPSRRAVKRHCQTLRRISRVIPLTGSQFPVCPSYALATQMLLASSAIGNHYGDVVLLLTSVEQANFIDNRRQ